MEEKFLTVFKEALEIEGEISMDDIFRDHPAWDSLSNMSLIAMLDSEFNVQIESAIFEKMKTVGDIYKFIQSKQPG